MNKEKNFISAVIYVHNAEDRIGGFLTTVLELLEKNFEHSEIICVNDFSTDNSVQEIKKVSGKATTAALSILNMSGFHGVEVAMNAGVDLSIGDFVLELDGTRRDYDPEEIMNAYRKVLQGWDIVSASPDRKQRLTSRIFYRLYERFSANHQRMQTETFRILSRRAINRVASMSRTVPYRKGLYASCGLRMANLKYQALSGVRAGEDDRLTRRYRTGLGVDSLLLFTDAGYVLAKAMTFVMMLISLFMLIYTVVIYAMAKPVEGWTTTILFLSIAFLGLFAILTVIIKYLQILLTLSFKRTKYSFESIEKLTK